MGKQQSKNDECILVNAHLNKVFEEQVWKKKAGFNFANYDMNQPISELSVCCLDVNKCRDIPLKVQLPPQKMETETAKVLTIDQKNSGSIYKKESNQQDSRLNVEEFECDVQFQGCSENSKQEWSFTLYDFDGHGKITKEDLASLLKTLYDAVGSSIKLPSNGTKTLKLRLTVGQDDSQVPSLDQNTPVNADRLKDTPCSGVGPKAKKDALIKLAKVNNLVTSKNGAVAATKICNQCVSMMGSNGRRSVILSCHEQQQLSELVQENMERNHVRQQAFRSHVGQEEKRRQKGTCTRPEDKSRESQDRRNYYLDLAGVENNTSRFQVSVPASCTANHRHHGHSRSHYHEVGAGHKCDGVEPCSRNCEHDSNGSPHKHREKDVGEKFGRSCEEQGVRSGEHVCRTHSHDAGGKSPKNQMKPTPLHKHGRHRPVSLPTHVPDSVSPHHHHRHRHREKDHSFAMQQVAEWIEREHSFRDNAHSHMVVQRHEHHHVHEYHHHHHYHHYYQT